MPIETSQGSQDCEVHLAESPPYRLLGLAGKGPEKASNFSQVPQVPQPYHSKSIMSRVGAFTRTLRIKRLATKHELPVCWWRKRAYHVLELAGPLVMAVEPGQVLGFLQDDHVGGGGRDAVHGVAHREDPQQQAVVPPSVEHDLEIRGDACSGGSDGADLGKQCRGRVQPLWVGLGGCGRGRQLLSRPA